MSRIRPKMRRPLNRTNSPRLPRLQLQQRLVPEWLLALPSALPVRTMSRLRQNLPPLMLPLPNRLLPPRFHCAVVCRESPVEIPGRRKA